MIAFHVETNNDSIQHHCGVVGIHTREVSNIPAQLFYSLFSLQHRGQESAGIAYRKPEKLVTYKDLGMVSTVLSHYLGEEHSAHCGIGHVRYSTHGGNRLENVQPIVISCNKGEVALAHNGTISNSQKIKESLFEDGSIFQSTTDTELILHLIARSRKEDFNEALDETLLQLEGAFSLVMIHDDSLLAIRDPWGFRPLFMGKKEGLVAFASETCALDILQIKDYRSVEPGEIIQINKQGITSRRFAPKQSISQCIFELIYFARPDSRVYDESVHIARKRMGAFLAEIDTVEADIVVPVPDSGNIAAMGFAEASGIPLEQGLTRNHFIGRSFILPTTAQREFAVRIKLNPVKEAIKGKRIILIDDSLVRGTTSKILVKLLREAGAKEIHLRLCSPELKWPCFFGIDIPTREELISNTMNPEELAQFIGADSVMFLPLKGLSSCVSTPENFCTACFNGIYPIPVEGK
ncbi:MAG: amidophosphoribosyltransferase [Spirochaetales bacterium]|nr:amidophosphoribosyltransferase [Spirochaetales bacterium]